MEKKLNLRVHVAFDGGSLRIGDGGCGWLIRVQVLYRCRSEEVPIPPRISGRIETKSPVSAKLVNLSNALVLANAPRIETATRDGGLQCAGPVAR